MGTVVDAQTIRAVVSFQRATTEAVSNASGHVLAGLTIETIRAMTSADAAATVEALQGAQGAMNEETRYGLLSEACYVKAFGTQT